MEQIESLVTISPRYVLLTVVLLLDPLFFITFFSPMQLKGSLVFEVPEFLEHKFGISHWRVEKGYICVNLKKIHSRAKVTKQFHIYPFRLH